MFPGETAFPYPVIPNQMRHAFPASTLASLSLLWSVLPAAAQLPPREGAPKVITSYREILEWIPKDTMPPKGTKWTQVQMDAVNALFEEKLKSEDYVVEMRLTVTDVPRWGGHLQVYSEIENREGYHIRYFGVFPEEKKAELATVKIGEKVALRGKLTSLRYHILWDQFTLSIVSNAGELSSTRSIR